MVPSTFSILYSLPLTPSGKVDRRALPPPDQPQANNGRAFVEPRTPIEAEIAGLWRGILHIENVGIHDNFFELGGHSLLLTQLASRIRRLFGVDLPLRVLFDTPTISEMREAILARQVRQVDATKVGDMLERIKQLSPDEIKALLEEGRAELYEYSE
jgi:hypothetical protein